MRSNWVALRAGLMRSIESRDAIIVFEKLRSDSEALRSFDTPVALVAAIASNADLDARDPALWTLVRAAHDPAMRQLAQALLLLCFWPPLDCLFRRRLALFRQRPQDLVSEITTRFTLEVQRIDLRHVTCLTATLLRNTDRNLVAARIRDRKVAASTVAVTPEAASMPPLEPTVSLFALPSDRTDTDSVTTLRAWLQRAVGPEADLVVEAVIEGKSRLELAGQLGISHAATRKRLERALARARRFLLARTQSQTAPSPALAN